MLYEEFLQIYGKADLQARSMVGAIESALREGIPLPELVARPAALPEGKVWKAFVYNAWKLRGVSRISGGAYAIHPTRMALTAMEILHTSPGLERIQVMNLFHDYLEEGDGRSAEGIARARAELPDAEEVIGPAVLLSEPQIPLQDFGGDPKVCEAVAYVIQVSMADGFRDPEVWYTACLMDKLDNLHDLSYITENPRFIPDKKASKLREKMAYFQFVVDHFGDRAAALPAAFMRMGIVQQMERYGITREEMQSSYEVLCRCMDAFRPRMEDEINLYHESLGLSWESERNCG